MTRILPLLTLCLVFGIGHSCVSAQGTPGSKAKTTDKVKQYILPPGVTEEMLAPPPVPRFMLEKPAKPLSLLEMSEQARDAESKAATDSKPALDNQKR